LCARGGIPLDGQEEANSPAYAFVTVLLRGYHTAGKHSFRLAQELLEPDYSERIPMKKIKLQTIAMQLVASAAALTLPGLAHASWPDYTLYSFEGYSSDTTKAFGLNSYGDTVGLAYQGYSQSFFTGLYAATGGNSIMPALPAGWTNLQFNGVSDGDYMVGQFMLGYYPKAVGYQYNDQLVDMTASLPNAKESFAVGINNQGLAVGSYDELGTHGVVFHMFRWNKANNTINGDWPNLYAAGINEVGTMVAENTDPAHFGGQSPQIAIVPPTTPPHLITAPSTWFYVWPAGISTNGGVEVVGEAMTDYTNSANTYKWAFAYNWAQNKWQTLKSPGTSTIENHALGVDQAGTHIVGSCVSANGIEEAVVWELVSGEWVPNYLSDILPTDTYWRYTEATAINPYGAISGWGQHLEDGTWVTRAFLAQPIGTVSVTGQEGPIYGGSAGSYSVRTRSENYVPVTVQLSSDSGDVQLPRTVQIPSMTVDVPLTVDTVGVDAPTTVEITAKLGAATTTQRINVIPAAMTSLTVTPNYFATGGFGKIALVGKAGPSGLVATISSSDPTVVVPTTVNVPAGANSVTFPITIGKGATIGKVVTITATLGSKTLSQPFTVN